MDSREGAILKTLLYSNFFDYPLKKEELYNFLIGKKLSKNEFTKALDNTSLPIDSSDGFYFLQGKQKLVKKRQQRELISLEKLRKAELIIKKLSLIPTIKLIGISGTLAVKNCAENDDIDIFVVAENGLAWTTRFLAVIMLIILGVYRNKNSKRYKDKICLNLILDEDRIFFENQDLFTAHEIVQLLPVFGKDKAYQKFISANSWIKEILPNWQVNQKPIFSRRQSYLDKLMIVILKIIFLEKILKVLQLFYMRKDITREKLEDGFIGLHPFDYKDRILKDYNQTIAKFGLQ
ncbi:MAG: hypothetical protein ABSE17_00725 [Candidatus Levyibacteriota bacterium]|jgi:hypothetical protein